MQIKSIGVVGAGQMGNGIAHGAALAGFDVVLSDIDLSIVRRGLATIEANLNRQVKKGAISEDAREATLQRIRPVVGLDGLCGCELVIEAVIEDYAVKVDLFRQLDSLLGKG